MLVVQAETAAEESQSLVKFDQKVEKEDAISVRHLYSTMLFSYYPA